MSCAWQLNPSLVEKIIQPISIMTTKRILLCKIQSISVRAWFHLYVCVQLDDFDCERNKMCGLQCLYNIISMPNNFVRSASNWLCKAKVAVLVTESPFEKQWTESTTCSELEYEHRTIGIDSFTVSPEYNVYAVSYSDNGRTGETHHKIQVDSLNIDI